MVTIENNYKIEYFIKGPKKEAVKRTSAKLTKNHNQYQAAFFLEIECFKGIFSHQVKE